MSGTSVVPYQQKRKQEMKCTIDTHNELDQPLNYGFFGLETIDAANDEDPRPPVSPRKGKHTVQHKEGKSHGRCLRLNNNSITTLKSLKQFTELKFEDWKDIAWIDFSHNELQKIEPELTEFENLQTYMSDIKLELTEFENLQTYISDIKLELTEFENLQILYLHGNGIADPAQIDQLIPLKNLRKLTLHGNPIESTKGYRFLVLSKLPQLQCLDFSRVTKAEMKTAKTLEGMNSWGLKKKKKVEEDE